MGSARGIPNLVMWHPCLLPSSKRNGPVGPADGISMECCWLGVGIQYLIGHLRLIYHGSHVLEFRCHAQLETSPQLGMADFPSLNIAVYNRPSPSSR